MNVTIVVPHKISLSAFIRHRAWKIALTSEGFERFKGDGVVFTLEEGDVSGASVTGIPEHKLLAGEDELVLFLRTVEDVIEGVVRDL